MPTDGAGPGAARAARQPPAGPARSQVGSRRAFPGRPAPRTPGTVPASVITAATPRARSTAVGFLSRRLQRVRDRGGQAHPSGDTQAGRDGGVLPGVQSAEPSAEGVPFLLVLAGGEPELAGEQVTGQGLSNCLRTVQPSAAGPGLPPASRSRPPRSGRRCSALERRLEGGEPGDQVVLPRSGPHRWGAFRRHWRKPVRLHFAAAVRPASSTGWPIPGRHRGTPSAHDRWNAPSGGIQRGTQTKSRTSASPGADPAAGIVAACSARTVRRGGRIARSGMSSADQPASSRRSSSRGHARRSRRRYGGPGRLQQGSRSRPPPCR